MYDLPTTVTINGKVFKIHNNGDYRAILNTIAVYQDQELTQEEQILTALTVFYEDINSIEDIEKLGDIKQAVYEMMRFIAANDEETGAKMPHKLIDWEQDEKLIVSAVNKVAGTEIRALPYLHWWTFIGYYMAIGECSLSTVVGIRSKIMRGKKLEKYEQDFKRQNPQYFTWKKDQKEAEQLLSKIWQEE